MRVALEQLDTRGVELELPTGQDGVRQSVALRSARELRGTLVHESGKLTLSGLAAEEIVCQTIGLLFGKVRLSEGELAAHALRADLDRTEGHTSLDAEAGSVQAAGSAVDAGSFHVDGQVRLEQLRLAVRDGVGQLGFGSIEVKGFTLRDGPLSIVADSVIARNLHIVWGQGLALSAESLSATGVRLLVSGVELLADGFVALDASWREGRARVGSVSLTQAKVTADLSQSTTGSAAPAQPGKTTHGKAKLSDLLGSGRADKYLRIFDTLFGHVDVDVEVDMSVPVIGSRRAVHEMRIPIDGGSVDYRKLESNLARLEDSLLDFAVRDGALGLELGIPLLPTRGRGKQLVVWDLNERDLALAEQNRVRLAVLPKARLAVDLPGSEEGSDKGEDKSAFGLRHVGLANIDVRLGLAHQTKEPSAVLNRLLLDDLALHGTVHHDLEGPAEQGELSGGLLGLDAQVSHLPIGENDLSIQTLTLDRLSDVHVAFLGPQPTHLNAEVTGLSLTDVVFVHPKAA